MGFAYNSINSWMRDDKGIYHLLEYRYVNKYIYYSPIKKSKGEDKVFTKCKAEFKTNNSLQNLINEAPLENISDGYRVYCEKCVAYLRKHAHKDIDEVSVPIDNES